MSSSTRIGLMRARSRVASSRSKPKRNSCNNSRYCGRQEASPSELISKRKPVSPRERYPASAIAITSASSAGSSTPIASTPTCCSWR
ncbi:Uncharacterised protein [Mycobacteroides abscessus subsp. abscessus]|nr:Uncharacterised protein [Mycobacteroides abscessus subsp. abscessus]